MDNKGLFLEWTGEIIRDCAGDRARKHVHQTYKRALDNMTNYTGRLMDPTDCAAIKYVGRSLITKLEERLRAHCTAHGLVYPGGGGSMDETPAPVAQKRKQTTREYVPRYKSGGYALLLALHDHNQAHDGVDVPPADKETLMQLAEAYSETPMNRALPNTYYTAWSSMRTLVEKGFVIELKLSRKKGFIFTDTGREMAGRLRALEDGQELPPLLPKRPVPTALEEPVAKKRALQPSTSAEFHYVYLDNQGTYTNKQEEAHVLINEQYFSVSYRIAFTPGQSSPLIASIASTIEPLGTLLTAWIHEDLASPIAPGIPNISVPTTTIVPSLPRSNSLLPAASFQKPARSLSFQTTADPSHEQLVTFPAHSYTIQLITDTREVNSKTPHTIINDFLKLGLEPLVRPLELGDFLWIATSNDPSNPHEIVLDCIIERKTMRDLISSVLDGRYKEQKHRLERSGLEHITYILEGYNETDAENFGSDAIQTTLSALQVIHGFFLKQTSILRETAAYIALLDKYIKKRYHGQELIGLHMDGTNAQYQMAKERHAGVLPTFSTFSKMNRKAANFTTVADMTLPLLQSIQGVSGDKATSITNKYPTMSSLLRAYDHCASREQAQQLLIDTSCPISRRRIPTTLSERIHHVLNE